MRAGAQTPGAQTPGAGWAGGVDQDASDDEAEPHEPLLGWRDAARTKRNGSEDDPPRASREESKEEEEEEKARAGPLEGKQERADRALAEKWREHWEREAQASWRGSRRKPEPWQAVLGAGDGLAEEWDPAHGTETDEDSGSEGGASQRTAGGETQRGAGLVGGWEGQAGSEPPLEKQREIHEAGSVAGNLLVAALAVFGAGSAVGALVLCAKVQGGLPKASHVVALTPVWLGNAASLVLQIAALCVFLPRARKTIASEPQLEHQVMQTERAMPFAKALCRWSCCDPLVGVMPPLPYLAFLTWFEVWVGLRLDGKLEELNSFGVVAPLLVLEACALVHLVLVSATGFLTGTFIVCALLSTLLAAACTELGGYWWVAFAPVWLWFAALAVVLGYLVANHVRQEGNVRLRTVQAWALAGYSVSAAAAFALAVCAQVTLNRPGAVAAFPVLGLLAFVALMALFAAAVCVAAEHVHEFTLKGNSTTKIVGAGWNNNTGLEDWGLLGMVMVLNERVHSIPVTACLQLTTRCSASSREGGGCDSGHKGLAKTDHPVAVA